MRGVRRNSEFTTWTLRTVIEGVLPDELCDALARRVQQVIDEEGVDLVEHTGLGTDAVSDLGGEYKHHIFKGWGCITIPTASRCYFS